MSFRTRLLRIRESIPEPGGIRISPPSDPDALPWDEQVAGALARDEWENDSLPPASGYKPTTIGEPSAGDRQRQRRGLLAVALAAIVLVLALGFGLVRYNAYAGDLRQARALAASGQYALATARYSKAIGEWPFNDTAKREMAGVQSKGAATPPPSSSPNISAIRLAIYQAHRAQRSAMAQQADADANATATAEAQATIAAHSQATANAAIAATAQGTATANAGLEARATAQARASATASAATIATARAGVSATVVRLPSNNVHPVVYVAIGASDVVGVGANDPASQSWVEDLARKLPSGSQLIKLGKSGALLSEGIQQDLPAAIASHPDVVTVWMAVNDINARIPPPVYRQELDRLLTGLRSQTHAAIYVGNVPDLTLLPVYHSLDKAQLTGVIQAYNLVIAQEAAAHGATMVDLYLESQQTLPTHPEYVSPSDGFHPSTAGYADLANYWWSVMQGGH
jgi:lysophospholipase L1-like esterase